MRDFHSPGVYRGFQGWANGWDLFHHIPSREGRGRRLAVELEVCLDRIRVL